MWVLQMNNVLIYAPTGSSKMTGSVTSNLLPVKREVIVRENIHFRQLQD